MWYNILLLGHMAICSIRCCLLLLLQRWFVCLCVCLLVTTVNPEKTAEPIEMLLGGGAVSCGSNNCVLGWGLDPN